jgi:methionyl-tRNA synthetase
MSTTSHFLSTAIPYVNGSPHIGHAQEFVIADALARHRRRLGGAVRFQSGTDDNSLKSARAAAALGVSPAVLVARHAGEFQKVAQSLDVHFDDFVKTSADPRHAPAVTRLWNACERAGDLERRTYRGLYCTGCEQFVSGGELPDDRCPEHAAPLEEIEEQNYFFRASRYGETIRKAIESNTLRIEPEERRREVLRFLEGGLRDFSVSRSAARARNWGIPVPRDPSQVVYVWFDALANYISTLGYATSAPLFGEYWERSRSRTHVIGKGVLRFHAAYWPAILLSAGLPLPTEILVHGYVTLEGRKIGKSLGNAVGAEALIDRYGSDAFRYYALRHIQTTADSDFSEERLVTAHDTELADQFGNLLRRAGALVVRHFSAKIPEPGPVTEADIAVREEGERALDEHVEAFGRFDLNEAAASPLRLLTATNRYFDAQAPWALGKRGERERLATVLFTTLEATWRAAWLLEPIVPRATARVRSDFGAAEAATRSTSGRLEWGTLPAGTPLSPGAPLFPKLRPIFETS